MSRICTYEGCNKEYYARGFCSSHFGKFARTNHMEGRI